VFFNVLMSNLTQRSLGVDYATTAAAAGKDAWTYELIIQTTADVEKQNFESHPSYITILLQRRKLDSHLLIIYHSQ
jgi:hypothetical protein